MSREMEVILSVRDLTVVLEGRTILRDISFDLERGSTLAIIGPNGSGKTVLLRCLLGIIPYSGTIRWASGVKRGYVPQRWTRIESSRSPSRICSGRSAGRSGCL